MNFNNKYPVYEHFDYNGWYPGYDRFGSNYFGNRHFDYDQFDN